MRKLIAGAIGIILATVCIIVLSVQPKVHFGATSQAPEKVEDNAGLANVLQSLPALDAYFAQTQENAEAIEVSENFKPVTISDTYTLEYCTQTNTGSDPYETDQYNVLERKTYYGSKGNPGIWANAKISVYYLSDSLLLHTVGTYTTGSYVKTEKIDARRYAQHDYADIGGSYDYDQTVIEEDCYLLIKDGQVYVRFDKRNDYEKKYTVEFTITEADHKEVFGDPIYPEKEESNSQDYSTILSESVKKEINDNWLGVWYKSSHKMSQADLEKAHSIQQPKNEEEFYLLEEVMISELANYFNDEIYENAQSISAWFTGIGQFVAQYAPDDLAGTATEFDNESVRQQFADCMDISSASCNRLLINWINPYSPSVNFTLERNSGNYRYKTMHNVTIKNIGNTGISMNNAPTKDFWDVCKPAIENLAKLQEEANK